MFKVLIKYKKEWFYLCRTYNDMGESLIGRTSDVQKASRFTEYGVRIIQNNLGHKYLLDTIEVIDEGNYYRNPGVEKFECMS